MPLGVEVGLGLGYIVLDGDSAPRRKGHSSPTLRPMSIVAERSPISAATELLSIIAPCETHLNEDRPASLWYCDFGSAIQDHLSIPGVDDKFRSAIPKVRYSGQA